MAVSRHSVIAPEGWRYIIPILLAALVGQFFLQLWAIFLWLLFLISLFLFRDPIRHCPAAPLAIVSPVHGTIIEVGLKHDPFLNREANFMRIEMPFYTIFSIRSITEGKVMKQWNQARNVDNNSCPCFAIWIQTDEQDDVVLVLRPGRWLHRIKSYFIIGERVGQGHRMGFVLFGSIIDVYIAKTASVELEKGTKVSAGTDILAQLVHN